MDLFRGTVGGGRFRSPSDSRERRCGGGQARQAGSLEKAAPRQCDHGLAIVFGFLGSDPGIGISLSIGLSIKIKNNININININIKSDSDSDSDRCIGGFDSGGLESGSIGIGIGIGIGLGLSLSICIGININVNVNVNVSFNIRGRCIGEPDSGGLECGGLECGGLECGGLAGGGLGRCQSSAAVGVRGTLRSIVHQTVCSSIADELTGIRDFRQPAAGPLTRLSQA
jgi:hypothetical protein